MDNRKEKLLKFLYCLSKHKNSCIIKENVINLNTYAEWKFREQNRTKKGNYRVTGNFVVKNISNDMGEGVLHLHLGIKRYRIPIQERKTALFKIGDRLHLSIDKASYFSDYRITDFYGLTLAPEEKGEES